MTSGLRGDGASGLGSLDRCPLLGLSAMTRHHSIVSAAIVGKELKIARTTYEILQILGISLLDKTPVKELLTNNDYKNVKEPNYKQLSLSLF